MGEAAESGGQQNPLDDALMREVMMLAAALPREALIVCRDLLGVLTACSHEELAEVRQMLTAVRQLPGTPPGAKAVLRGGADLVRSLDRALSERERSHAGAPGQSGRSSN